MREPSWDIQSWNRDHHQKLSFESAWKKKGEKNVISLHAPKGKLKIQTPILHKRIKFGRNLWGHYIFTRLEFFLETFPYNNYKKYFYDDANVQENLI